MSWRIDFGTKIFNFVLSLALSNEGKLPSIHWFVVVVKVIGILDGNLPRRKKILAAGPPSATFKEKREKRWKMGGSENGLRRVGRLIAPWCTYKIDMSRSNSRYRILQNSAPPIVKLWNIPYDIWPLGYTAHFLGIIDWLSNECDAGASNRLSTCHIFPPLLTTIFMIPTRMALTQK